LPNGPPSQSIADLEQVADLDRWSLARQFRAAFGTSPTRFRTMRQLDHVRRLVKSGSASRKPRWTQALPTKAICHGSSNAPMGSRPRIGQRRSIERRVLGRPRGQLKWRVSLATM
jgi:AraC-type DNA-binding domain-containing proteins